jgi:hypothetical protein
VPLYQTAEAPHKGRFSGPKARRGHREFHCKVHTQKHLHNSGGRGIMLPAPVDWPTLAAGADWPVYRWRALFRDNDQARTRDPGGQHAWDDPK